MGMLLLILVGVVVTGLVTGGSTFATLLRMTLYLYLIFLLAFDLIAAQGVDRMVFGAFILWLALLVSSTIFLALGFPLVYNWMRDYASTLGLFGFVAARVYRLNRREKQPDEGTK